MLIPKCTSSEVTYQMIGIDLVELVMKNRKEAIEKWEQRKKGEKIIRNGTNKVQRFNPLVGISKEFCQLIRVEGQICVPCWKQGIKTIISQKHLEEIHNINIVGYHKLWIEIRDYFVYKKKQILDKPLERLKREEFRKKWTELLKEILEDTNKKTEEFCKQDYQRLC